MEEKLHLGIDFDGVTADIRRLQERVFKLMCPKIDTRELMGFSRKHLVVEHKIFSHREYEEFSDLVHGSERFKTELEPIKWALEYIQNFKRKGHPVTIVTLRSPGPYLNNAIHFVKHKKLDVKIIGTPRGQDKTRTVRKRKIKVFLDDRVGNLSTLIGIVPYRFFFSPTGEKISPNIATTVRCWREFNDLVEKIESETL